MRLGRIARCALIVWLALGVPAWATVTTTASAVTFLGDGSTTVFSFTFVGVATADISLTFIDASGNASVLSPSAYTLTLNAAQTGAPWGVGGSVTYDPSSVPIASGTKLIVTRSVPYTQTVSISNQGAFYPQAVEQALDLLALEIQQLANLFSTTPTLLSGSGSPLNIVSGLQGQFYNDTTNHHLWWKQTGSNNSIGWVQVGGT